MSRPEPVPEPDAEREVDLRSVWERIAARWWLPLLGAVAGAILGVLLAFGGGSTYEARALLYLGQPFTTAGGGQIQSLATNPRTVGEIIRSESALRAASQASEIPVGRLRGNVASAPIIATGQSRLTTPLVEIRVNGSRPARVATAANTLAERVLTTTGDYVNDKIEVLSDQIAALNEELEEIDRRVNRANAQLETILANDDLELSERLILTTNINSTIGFNEQRRGTVQTELLQARQLLSLAERVEQGRVVEPAVGVKTTATSARNALVVGALIGLILGCAAALFADPYLARRARSS
jgi:arsenate reductase-like glutaredoxin family protein